jgi:DNA-binding CsgD family transcriptional regulator
MSEIGKELGTSRHQVRIDLDSAMRKLGATEEGRELLDALDE